MFNNKQNHCLSRPSVIVSPNYELPPCRSLSPNQPVFSNGFNKTSNSMHQSTQQPINGIKNLYSNCDSSGRSSCSSEESQSSIYTKDERATFGCAPKRTKKSSNKANVIKICLVCGDVAKSLHFGAMCCDSCKAFFRRSVQASSFSSFSCNNESICKINKEDRKNCQDCRFQKCLNVGMKLSLVMPESERINLWKNKLQRIKTHPTKLQKTSLNGHNKLHRKVANGKTGNNRLLNNGVSHDSQTESIQSLEPPINIPNKSYYNQSKHHAMTSNNSYSTNSTNCNHGLISYSPQNLHHLSQEDHKLIIHLIELQKVVFSSIPYSKECYSDTTSALTNIVFVSSSRVYAFLSRIEDLYSMCKEDRKILLENGTSMSIYVHGAYMFDTKLNQFPDPQCKPYLRIPNVLSLLTTRTFAVFADAFQLLMSFYNNYAEIVKDEVIVAILTIIALFDEDSRLAEIGKCTTIKNKYITLLKNYLLFKEGERRSRELLVKFIQGFSLLKNIASNHDRVNIRTFPPEATSSPMLCQPFIKDRIMTLSELLASAVISDVPKYASVIRPNHNVETILKNSKSSIKKRDKRVQHYSSLTSALFGQENRTNELAALYWQNILSNDEPFQILQQRFNQNLGQF